MECSRIKKLVIAAGLFVSFPLFSEANIESEFYVLDLFESAKLRQEISISNAKSVNRYFIPEIDFSCGASLEQYVEYDFEQENSSFSVSVSHLFPGFTGLNYYFSENHTGVWNAGAAISVPLIFDFKTVKSLDNYGFNYGSEIIRSGNLSYQVELFEGKKNFVVSYGNYLYYKELVASSEEKLILLQEMVRDYEKLYQLGKISFFQFREKSSELENFRKEKMEAAAGLIDCEMRLRELGVEPDSVNRSLSAFVDDWSCHFERQFNQFGESYFSDELEKSQVRLQAFSKTDDLYAGIPRLKTDFCFSETRWSLNISMDIFLFPDISGGSVSKRIRNYNQLANLELRKLERKHSVTRKFRKARLEMLSAYCESLEQDFKVEEKRLEMLEELAAVGKATDFDSRWQKNVCRGAELGWRYGELQKLACLADFY